MSGGLGGYPGCIPGFEWVPGMLGSGGNGAAYTPGSSAGIGAGGGGGSGRITWAYTNALSANQTVTIGTSGAAGSGATTNGAAGNPGCVGIWYWPVR